MISRPYQRQRNPTLRLSNGGEKWQGIAELPANTWLFGETPNCQLPVWISAIILPKISDWEIS
jgi:hypothetical protein